MTTFYSRMWDDRADIRGCSDDGVKVSHENDITKHTPKLHKYCFVLAVWLETDCRGEEVDEEKASRSLADDEGTSRNGHL